MPRPMDIVDPKRDLDKVDDKDFDLSEDKKGSDRESFEIEESKGGGTFYLILGIIALVVATAFALYILYRDDKPNSNNKTSVSVTSTSTTDSTSQTPTASPTESGTTLSIGSPSETKTSYAGLSVRVANGNNKTGEASRIKKILEDEGFSITSVGNATKTYEDTIVFYKTGQEDLAEALKKALEEEYSATIKKSDETVGNYDAVIALGKN